VLKNSFPPMIENSQSRYVLGIDLLGISSQHCFQGVYFGSSKAIESDGSLDYAENVLERFDFVERASMAGSN
jgi:hypothetical protein